MEGGEAVLRHYFEGTISVSLMQLDWPVSSDTETRRRRCASVVLVKQNTDVVLHEWTMREIRFETGIRGIVGGWTGQKEHDQQDRNKLRHGCEKLPCFYDGE